MSVKRIIPCLDITNGRVVKGVNFINLKDAGDPVEIAKAYDDAGADELVFLNITGNSGDRGLIIDMVERIRIKVSIPFTVGGGISELSHFEEVLRVGADKVSINSAAFKKPELIKEAAKEFGSQRIVVAIDAKKSRKDGYDVYLSGGRVNTNRDVVDWAVEAEKLGAGEILLTSMDGDGTRTGYDIELTQAVSSAIDIPVIASGGAGALEHFYDAIVLGGADGVLAASLFHFKELEIKEVKEYLKNKGIQVNI